MTNYLVSQSRICGIPHFRYKRIFKRTNWGGKGKGKLCTGKGFSDIFFGYLAFVELTLRSFAWTEFIEEFIV
jgi:hypothetical protein